MEELFPLLFPDYKNGIRFENSLASLLCSSGKNSKCVDNKRYGALGIIRKKKKPQYPKTNLSECHCVRTIISHALAGDKTQDPSVKGRRITGRSMTGLNKHFFFCGVETQRGSWPPQS
jgi:hypothetical protein